MCDPLCLQGIGLLTLLEFLCLENIKGTPQCGLSYRNIKDDGITGIRDWSFIR